MIAKVIDFCYISHRIEVNNDRIFRIVCGDSFLIITARHKYFFFIF
jgi:hypothetical protein